ncbi:hypothetical protein DERF_013560 [Dermatophagoides farinae]|uniref:Uncharacterized protein n=1 Tax=Dermatophagoides farinae TaxID=6954 RepID=A0A922HPZ3_DERFA|nr:hypothetical protein DERF_013560 [Dermatophagoides farinae]
MICPCNSIRRKCSFEILSRIRKMKARLIRCLIDSKKNPTLGCTILNTLEICTLCLFCAPNILLRPFFWVKSGCDGVHARLEKSVIWLTSLYAIDCIFSIFTRNSIRFSPIKFNGLESVAKHCRAYFSPISTITSSQLRPSFFTKYLDFVEVVEHLAAKMKSDQQYMNSGSSFGEIPMSKKNSCSYQLIVCEKQQQQQQKKN